MKTEAQVTRHLGKDGDKTDLLKPTVIAHGPACDHNIPCAVEQDKLAVLQANTGVFLPSWEAQGEGWMLIKVPKWLKPLLMRYVPGEK